MAKKKGGSHRRRLTTRKGRFDKYNAKRRLVPIPLPDNVESEPMAEEEWETLDEPEVTAVNASVVQAEVHHPASPSPSIDTCTFVVESLELSESPMKEACERDKAPKVVYLPASAPHSELNFIETVWRMIRQKLPSNWVCTPRDTRLYFYLTPTPRGLLVQRSFLVQRDGQVHFSVHSKPLEASHAIWKMIPSQNVLLKAPVHEFAEHVCNIFRIFNNFSVCPGNPEGHYESYLRKAVNMVLEHNTYKEKYLEERTFRALQCQRLIPVAWKRCESCTTLRKQLQRRIKRTEKRCSPHPNTNLKHLLSPHWRKLVKKCRRNAAALSKKLNRTQKKFRSYIEENGVYVGINGVESLKSTLTKYKSENKLSEAQHIFIEEQLKFGGLKSNRGMKWHPLLVRLALQLQSIGGSAVIDAINDSQVMRLPTVRTLYDYTHAEKRSAAGGLCETVIEKLRVKMEELPENSQFKRYHTLMMDEMTISSNLVISKSTGQLVGFVDLPPFEQSIQDFKNLVQQIDVGVDSEANRKAQASGEGDETAENVDDPDSSKSKTQGKYKGKRQDRISSEAMATYHGKLPQKAKKMLTFMVRGLCSDVKEIVASYGVGDLSSAGLYFRVWKVIEQLEMNGIYVLCVTCDGSPINRRFIKMNKPYTKLASKVVFDTENLYSCKPRILYFISDVPHLLKTIRNCFYKSRSSRNPSRLLWKNGEYIVWDTIKRLYDAEKGNTVRLACKLQRQVVYLNSFSMMNVKYAAVVMSHTVANALVRMKFGGIKETVNFIRRVNDFFDCLNGRSNFQAKRTRNQNLRPYRHHCHLEDNRFKVLMSFLNYLKAWEKEVLQSPVIKPNWKAKALLSPQTLYGIEMTIFSFIKATKFLFSEGAHYVMARRFCQDPLEQYFSRQRASVGGGNNPTKFQYLNTERTYQVVKGLGFKRRGNTQAEKEPLPPEVFEPLPKRKSTRRPRSSRRSLSFGDAFLSTPDPGSGAQAGPGQQAHSFKKVKEKSL